MNMGPLQDGQTVVIIGGGPRGTACGLALLKLARSLGRQIRVVLYDGKAFVGETNHNQCAGVFSPPIQEILAQFDVPFPHRLVQRTIQSYVLHGERRQIRLTHQNETSYALRRVQFDAYMLDQARTEGVEIREGRVVDLEFLPDRVNVYADATNCEAALVIGAFGLDPGSAAILAGATPYRPPRFLRSVVTELHPPAPIMEKFGNDIHVFLPRHPRTEFGAITPKGDHLTINIAGAKVNSRHMDTFFNYAPVRQLLCLANPASPRNPRYRGRFPISVARNYYGDRYVCLGDAAGLVRAFKGKGVNSACQTALWAAETALTVGISRSAFDQHYRNACRQILNDLPYGQTIRWLAITGSYLGLLDRLITTAHHDPILQRAIFDAVSAHRTYRAIAANVLYPPVLARLIYAFVRPKFRRSLVSAASKTK